MGDRAELRELCRVQYVLFTDVYTSRYTCRVIPTGAGAGVRAREGVPGRE